MNLSVGIVGLPNVGKSTLFNALLKRQQALAVNYPFATIEPNVGVVSVPDQRLEVLADIITGEKRKIDVGGRKLDSENGNLDYQEIKDSKNQDQKNLTSNIKNSRPPIVPAVVKFLDIAGLVNGANEGAGLGNKFLSHIREVSIIAHVVRDFEDENVVKEGSVDPKTDYQTIQTELMLADLSTISKIKDSSFAKASADRQKSKVQIKSQKEVAEKIFQSLNKGTPVRDLDFSNDEKTIVDQLFLLSSKPEIIVLNVAENDYTESKIEVLTQRYADLLEISSEKIVVISAKVESELSELSEEDQKDYLANLGLKKSGLERLIKKAYEVLGLISFLTAGEKEVRAWTLRRGSTALTASGAIHTDFIKNFIKAEVVNFEDFVQFKGWKGAREKGKAKLEGRDYIIKDGDVVEFKIGK